MARGRRGLRPVMGRFCGEAPGRSLMEALKAGADTAFSALLRRGSRKEPDGSSMDGAKQWVAELLRRGSRKEPDGRPRAG